MRSGYLLLYSSSEGCEQHGGCLQSVGWTLLHFQLRTSSFEFFTMCFFAATRHTQWQRRSTLKKVRKKKFSIGSGAEPNPLTEDSHHAVHKLSLELYKKKYPLLMQPWSAPYRSLPLSKLNIAF